MGAGLIQPVSFRFEAEDHIYSDESTGEVFPSATELLKRAGHVDDQWFTEESSERGTAVHTLTAQYDLGALDARACVSRYRAWLLAWVDLIGKVPHGPMAVEEPRVHPFWRFGCRPDRTGQFYRREGVLEIKSGDRQRSHAYQTALQAIVYEPECHVPPEYQIRLCAYITRNGGLKLEEHVDASDFKEAYHILKTYHRG